MITSHPIASGGSGELRESTHAPLGCPRCGGPVDLRTRHIEVCGSAIRAYCSEACLHRPSVAPAAYAPRRSPIVRLAKVAVLPSLVAGGLAAYALRDGDESADEAAAGAEKAAVAPPMGPPRSAASETLPEHGPAWPPTEEERIRLLADDAWLHPLRGPERRMPIRSSRTFGAPRPGSRPPECKAGHCGVDIGGDEWGEPVLAVRDGVVERVERSPHANGGRYVWLAHRDRTVFTHYFHLAAIPPDLEVGQTVSRGQTIGLLGASGVVHSGPHLHFTVAVQLPGEQSRQYIDPEPLIALWPLEVPLTCDTSTRVSTAKPPGRVIGSYPSRGGARSPRRVAARSGDSQQGGGRRSTSASAPAADGDGGEAADDEGDVSPVSNISSLGDGGRDEAAERVNLPSVASP